MKPLEEKLSQYKEGTRTQNRHSFRRFCEWAKVTDQESVADCMSRVKVNWLNGWEVFLSDGRMNYRRKGRRIMSCVLLFLELADWTPQKLGGRLTEIRK